MALSLTFEEARDEIFALLKTAWDTTGFPIKWPGIKFSKPEPSATYAEVIFHHLAGGQVAFGSGVSMWRRAGSLLFRVNTPMGEGFTDTYSLAKVITDAIEGNATQGGVWFRETSIREGDEVGGYDRVTVETIFEYTEVK